ncbi:MAG: hypothetical protein HY423_16755 [Candidatus Lambdaproteobacteria bacterium]|nr:hypothetical protein [Candidatus Lambdaproteobacteria bacterium]
MPYTPLTIPPDVPDVVRRLVQEQLEPQLRDIHAMLRLPLDDDPFKAGGNVTIASALLNLVGGISIVLYKSTGSSGSLFKNVLTNFYPWDDETGGLSGDAAANTLYETFRNNLTHSMGLSVKEKKKHGPATRRLAPMGKPVKIKRWRAPDIPGRSREEAPGPTDEFVTSLESDQRPQNISATLTERSDATVLLVESLYWGIRRMVEKLLNDRDAMTNASKFLAPKIQAKAPLHGKGAQLQPSRTHNVLQNAFSSSVSEDTTVTFQRVAINSGGSPPKRN